MGDERPSERFPCSSRVFGLITLAGLVVVFALVIADGRSVGHAAVLAGIVLIGLGTWLTMVRPALHAHDDHILVRNALTDTKVPWHLVESVDVGQVLIIRTDDRVVQGLAVGRTVRQQLRPSRRGGGTGSDIKAASTFGGDSAARVDYADFVVSRIDELATANRTRSRELDGLDKQWRSAEVSAVLAATAVFGALIAIVILR